MRGTKRTMGMGLGVFLAALVGCTTTTGGGGYAGGATDATANDAGGGGSDTAAGSNRNTATVQTTDPDGKKADVKTDKPATKGDAENKTAGAANAGKVLTLFIADAAGTVITVHIDTEVHALPKKGIAVTEVNGSAFVTLAGGGGIYNSKAKGSIDIDGCPTKEGEAVVGAFKGVEVVNEAPVGGPASLTLDGPFHLVYWGGAGAIACTPPTTGGGGGKVELGSFGKPAGASCDANPCDGGSNTSRNCCPYVPCMEPCIVKCATEAQSCMTACGFDFACPQGCQTTMLTCIDTCLTTCKVDATCKSAIGKLNSCEAAQDEVCAEASDPDVCAFDKCCSEWKGAF